jgi:hypothetical protein
MLAITRVQHRVGLRFELAVGDDAADFGLDLRGQLAVLRGRELAGVGRPQLRFDQAADAGHAGTQRLVGRPLAALVQGQRPVKASWPWLRLRRHRAGGERGCRPSQPAQWPGLKFECAHGDLRLSWQATVASLLRRSGAACDGSIDVART